LVLGLCGTGLAQTSATPALLAPPADRLSLTTSPMLGLSPAQKDALERAAEVEKLYADVKHEAAGTAGLALVRQGVSISDDLRLKIANSLAWTGRLNEAYAQYELLLNGRFDGEARLALANATRWRGRADLAMPMYSQVLALDPDNTGAREGLALGERELRPSTTVSLGQSADSGDMKRRYLTVSHRWRDAAGTRIFEVETRAMQDRIDPVSLRVPQADVTLRFQPLDVPLEPRVYVNLQGAPHSSVYGGARLKLGEGATHVQVDRLNWGAAAVSARALDAGLSAYHAGVESRHGLSAGEVYGRASVFRISDGNTLLTTSLKFTPSWQPLGPGIKAYVVTDTRDVRFNTPNYWSPVIGSGTASLGLLGEWSSNDWFFYTVGQLGRPLYGEAGNSWSASAAARRWLSKDYALGINVWGLSSVRDGANYRARSVSVNMEKLW
jgi:tetratricopeptide (TPR) repeat protein